MPGLKAGGECAAIRDSILIKIESGKRRTVSVLVGAVAAGFDGLAVPRKTPVAGIWISCWIRLQALHHSHGPSRERENGTKNGDGPF